MEDKQKQNAAASAKQWTTFFRRCLQERTRPEKFEQLSKTLHRKYPLGGDSISEILFKAQTTSYATGCIDPLLTFYIDGLLRLQQTDTTQMLSGLMQCTRGTQLEARDGVAGADANLSHNGHPELETVVFDSITRFCTSNTVMASLRDARKGLRILAKWMSIIVDANTENMMNELNTLTPAALQCRESLGILLVTLVEKPTVDQLLQMPPPQGSVKHFAQSLPTFIQLLTSSSMQVADRMDMLQKSYESLRNNQNVADFESGEDEKLALGQMQINNIMDGPQIHSRATLAVWLDALASGLPLLHESLLLNHMQARYKDDVQLMVSDLITAAFDVLAMAVNRGDQADKTFLLRSMIVNKLPLLMLSSFVPLGYEFSISQALNRLDPTLFPSFSQGFDISGGSSMLSDVRQDFLFSCALHSLIAEDAIERLLGENPMQTVTPEGKQMKANLVAECAGNAQKLERLIDGIEKMDGNAGAAVDATTEILHGFCVTKDTMSLKVLSSQLSRRPFSLDTILLFQGPATFLRPLCQLLNEWTYDDDQGERQPVYDEFSACLLLVLAFVYRFKLTKEDIGFGLGETFIEKLISGDCRALNVDALSQNQNKQLSDWVRGLFGEGVISDEQMSNCPPQDFYLLVPTVFKQSILACKLNAMNLETLKSGLELLLEPFLLPCLVIAMRWLLNHTWERHGDTDVLLAVLQKLVRPSSIHGEALAMHTTVLSIIGKPLTATLKDLQQQESSKPEIESLLEKLQTHLTYCRGAEASHSELHMWSANFGGGMLMGIRNCLNALCLWSAPTVVGGALPNYGYLQLHATVQLLGATPVLRALVEEIKAQHQNGLGEMALDVASSLICATSLRQMALTVLNGATSAQVASGMRLGLREALQVELEDAAKLILTDSLRGEILVRLGRSVERQLSSVSIADLQMGMPDMMQSIDLGASDALGAANLSAGDIATAAGNADLVMPEGTNDDLQLDINAAITGQDDGTSFDDVLGSANDDDIFGGLALDADMEF